MTVQASANRPSANKGKNMNKHTPTPWGVNQYGEVCQDKGEFYGLRDRVEVTGFLLMEASQYQLSAARTAAWTAASDAARDAQAKELRRICEKIESEAMQ